MTFISMQHFYRRQYGIMFQRAPDAPQDSRTSFRYQRITSVSERELPIIHRRGHLHNLPPNGNSTTCIIIRTPHATTSSGLPLPLRMSLIPRTPPKIPTPPPSCAPRRILPRAHACPPAYPPQPYHLITKTGTANSNPLSQFAMPGHASKYVKVRIAQPTPPHPRLVEPTAPV